MRKGHFMIDLCSIIESQNQEYLSLEHLRAIIYGQKIKNNKIKGRNETAFYGVTCSKDVYALLEKAKSKNENMSFFKKHNSVDIFYKIERSELESYLRSLIFLEADSNGKISAYDFNARNAYEIQCEQITEDYTNVEFFFIRAEIENIINAKIPYFENVEDVIELDLIPLNDSKSNETKEISSKSETAYLNIIGALLDTILECGKFENQAALISYLEKQYQGYTGLSERNLKGKFAKANQSLKTCL